MAEVGEVPQWSVGDRMRKARVGAGLKQPEMATEIGIGHRSVINYEADLRTPPRPVLVSWALRTGVPLWWLQGHACACGEPLTHSDGAACSGVVNNRRTV